VANILGGGAYYYRVSPDGTITNVQITNNAQPGTLLYLGYEELPQEGHDGPLAAGPGGTMWALDQGDFIELTPGGQEILTIGVGNNDPVQLVGNGTSAAIESVGSCITNDAQGEHNHQCVSTVNSDGSETLLAELPDYDGYNNYLVHWAVMDQSGNVWLILDGKANGQASSGQYYVEVSPGGAVKVIPFTVPGDTGVVPVSQARPVLTSNGGLWVPDVQQDARWRLIQVVPK